MAAILKEHLQHKCEVVLASDQIEGDADGAAADLNGSAVKDAVPPLQTHS